MVAGLDIGADDYITKPFSNKELFARLRAVLRRSKDGIALEKTYAIDSLEVDTDKHIVKRAGDIIDLTPKEYDLLLFMLQNKEIALPKERLLKDVWGIEGGNTSNRLESYIKYLRQKVDAGYDRRLIITVRGVGYKISEISDK